MALGEVNTGRYNVDSSSKSIKKLVETSVKNKDNNIILETYETDIHNCKMKHRWESKQCQWVT